MKTLILGGYGNFGARVHTAGPFQHQRPDVALAAARAGAHYIDLADGRRFVCDFASRTDGSCPRHT